MKSGGGRSRLLREAITSQRWILLGAVLLLAGWQGAEALVPVIVGVIIDRGIATGDAVALAGWLAALAALFTVLSLGFRFGARLTRRASEYAGLDLRLRVTGRLLDPRGTATGRLPGELLNVATSDVNRVAQINRAVAEAVMAAAGLTVAAVVLLSASIQLGLVVLVGLPPVLLALNLLTGPLERRSAAEQEQAATAAAVASDLVGGLRVLKGLRAEQAATARYREASRASLAARLRATRLLAAHSGATLAVTSTFLAVVALVGGRLAAQGRISIGELVAAVGLTQYLIGPLSGVAETLAKLAQSRASAGRVAALLAAPPAVTGGSRMLPNSQAMGALLVHGLSHGALREVNLDISPGELVGVVAPEPATAAALLDCLARETDPEAGTIEIDGMALRELDLDAARTALLVAAHDTDLFEDTLIANVATTAARPEQIPAAMAASTADEVADSLPDGIPLTEQARSLSGGQRQRIALARALAADPAVLVLHDPTTAVDAATEARIAQHLHTIRAGRTTVLVTSSPALLAATDRVVMLLDGTVATQGTHAELVGSSPAYREAVLA